MAKIVQTGTSATGSRPEICLPEYRFEGAMNGVIGKRSTVIADEQMFVGRADLPALCQIMIQADFGFWRT